MTSEVDICNLGLIEVGSENLITSFADNSREAIVANLIYPQSRDFLLNAFTWNFARSRASLSETTSPDFGFDKAFQLPADCLRCITNEASSCSFKIEGTNLLTDADSVDLTYITKETDVTKFSPTFKEALICRIAYKFCNVITSDKVKAKDLLVYYKDLLKQAKRLDSMEGTPSSLKFSHYKRR